MASKICCGYDLRIGSIIVLIILEILTLILTLETSINYYTILDDDELLPETISETKITLIIATTLIGITLYGVFERKSSWLIPYFVIFAFIYAIEIFSPYAIIYNEKISASEKQTMMIYWFIENAISFYCSIVIFKYYQQLKKNNNLTQNGRVISVPLAPKIDV